MNDFNERYKRKDYTNYITLNTDDMSLSELSEKICEIQQEILHLAGRRKYLQTLPKGKKNQYTLKQSTAISLDINTLQGILTSLTVKKKKLRDTMQREREWYKGFYKEVCTGNSWIKRRLIANTNKKMGYSIDLEY